MAKRRCKSKYRAKGAKNKKAADYVSNLNMNSLSNDCILQILHHVPVRKLPRLRLISHRFDELVRLALRSRHTLSLLIGADRRLLESLHAYFVPVQVRHLCIQHPNLENTECIWTPSGIYYQKLSRAIVQSRVGSMPEALPNVTTFRVALMNNDNNTLGHIMYLLERYAPRLVALKMALRCDFDIRFGARLVHLINTSMPVLRDLYLDIHRNRVTEFGPVDFPVIRQLRTFHFGSLHLFHEVYDSYTRYGQENTDLVEFGSIRCGSPETTSCIDQFINKTEPRLADVFNTFCIRVCTIPRMNAFTARFHSISTLQVGMNNSGTMVNSMNSLAALTQLVFLHVYFLRVDDDGNSRWDLSADDDIPREQIRQLSSVKTLIFSIRRSKPLSHTALLSRHFGWIFPNVHILVTGHAYTFTDGNGCLACAQLQFDDVEDRRVACITRQLEPWVEQCSKLKKIQAPGRLLIDRSIKWQIRPLRPLPVQ